MTGELMAIQEHALQKTIDKLLSLPDDEQCVVDRWKDWFHEKKLQSWPVSSFRKPTPFDQENVPVQRAVAASILAAAISAEEARRNARREIRDLKNEIEDRKPRGLPVAAEESYLKILESEFKKNKFARGFKWRQAMIQSCAIVWEKSTGKKPPKIRWINERGKDEYDREPQYTFGRLLHDIWSDVMATDQRISRISFSDTNQLTNE